MEYYRNLSEYEKCLINKAKEIGLKNGDCKELSELCDKAYNDYKSGVISEKAYKKIYAVCIDYAYPR